MRKFTVTDRDGKLIESGDIVTDFRGDSHRFECVSRFDDSGRTPKVVVDGVEYYASVFNLTIKEEE